MLRRVVIDQVLTVDAVGILTRARTFAGNDSLIGPGLAALVLTSDPPVFFLIACPEYYT